MDTDRPSAGGNELSLHPQNKKNLAALLGVSVYVLNKMIQAVKDQLGEPAGTTYSINQVQFMVNKYGIIRARK